MILSQNYGKFYLRIDWTLLLLLISITGLGLLNLYSASANVKSPMFTQQIYWIFIGFSAFLITATIDYRIYKKYAYLIYVLGIISLILVLFVGMAKHGSQRWLIIGPMILQPSELMKIAVIFALARQVDAAPPKTDAGRTLKELIWPVVIISVPFLLIMIQPDLGTGLLILLIFFSVFFLLRLRLRSIITLASSLIILMPLIWTFVLKGYQKDRILIFLDPSIDPIGEGWHYRQSIFAIGSGKLFGKGFLSGTQSKFHFLPAQWSDFPFSVWAEEWGLLGSTVLIGLYMWLILMCISIAKNSRDRFASVISIGVGALFFWHVIINIGMVMGLLPIVGVTLPLFSHGGSSMLTFMIAAGLIMSISSRKHSFE